MEDLMFDDSLIDEAFGTPSAEVTVPIVDELKVDELNVDDAFEDNKKEDSPTQNEDAFSVVLGRDLSEGGVLSEFNQEEVLKIAKEHGEAAAIRHMIESQIKKSTEELKSGFDTSYQEYVNMITGGVSKEEAAGIVRLEEFYKGVSDFDLKGEADDSVAARKELLTLNLRITTKWADDKIQRYVDKAYDSGEDVEEVDGALENLKAYIADEKQNAVAEAKKREDSVKEQQNKIIEGYKSTINGAKEFFKGEAVTDLAKQKMERLIFDQVKLPNGQTTNGIWALRERNPINFDTKLAYYISKGMFVDDPYDGLTKKAQTKAANELENFLASGGGRNSFGTMSGNRSSKTKNDDDWF